MQLLCWSKDFSVAGVAEEVDMSQVTLVDWFIRYREICASCLLKSDGPKRTVEIDECKSGTGKYCVTIVGVMRDGVWVFGGINRSKKKNNRTLLV